MADASHVIVDDEDIASAETNVESVVSNNNSTIKKKDYKDVNELHEELLTLQKLQLKPLVKK